MLTYDPLRQDFPSRRGLVYARRGMVCASQPLAAQAGLDMLKQGGSAADAAIAAAACLTVLEPTGNGLGSDAFALVWEQKTGRLLGLNASGVAPALADAAALRQAGHQSVPKRGWQPVMVPGAPAAWVALSRRAGRLPLEAVLAPAIDYARRGYAVTPIISRLWQQGYALFAPLATQPCFAPWLETFCPQGRAPRAGEVWRCEGLARSLEAIAQTDGEAFYRGALADKMDEFSRQTGGLFRKSDLAGYQPQWVEPLSVNYRGYEVWELPPNGDGIVALMALQLLAGFELPATPDEQAVHRQLEAMKLAFADGMSHVADPAAMRVTAQQILSPEYAARRREQIADAAQTPDAGDPHQGGTVYLCAADEEGNMVSFIQSNYMGFGAGIVIPGTGISLQNRGANFSLEEDAPNCLAPGKRAFHTIIPAFLTRNGAPVGPFGVMGAFMQPQGHVQVVMNAVDFHCNPQAALDAPRWQWVGGKTVQLEPGFDSAIAEGLRRRGHEVEELTDTITFGRGQLIWRNEYGTLTGATDPRADGTVAAW